MDGWYAGNILIGGLLGLLIIDPATGSMWKLDESVQVALKQQPVNNVEPVVEGVEEQPSLGEVGVTKMQGDRLTLLTLDQVPMTYRSRLVRVH